MARAPRPLLASSSVQNRAASISVRRRAGLLGAAMWAVTRACHGPSHENSGIFVTKRDVPFEIQTARAILRARGEAALREAIALHGEHRSDNRATPPMLMVRQPTLRACRARTLYGAVLPRAARVTG